MTPFRTRARTSVAALVAAAVVLAQTPSRAESKEQCIEAFERGQLQRDELKLRAARESFLVCANERCPAPIRKDCSEASEQVMRDLPTVSLGARDVEGHDLVDVRVFVDDVSVALVDSGRSVPLDPGPHKVRFEHPGFLAVTEKVVVRMGDHNRAIVATLRRPDVPTAPPARPPVDDEPARTSPWAYALGGAGLVALGSFAFFAVTGKNEKDKLAASCGPACSDSEIAGLKTRYYAADVSLLVGVVLLGAATWLFVSQPTTATPK